MIVRISKSCAIMDFYKFCLERCKMAKGIGYTKEVDACVVLHLHVY
jgi:hypothetical protein